MKNSKTILFFLLAAFPWGLCAGLTEEELKPFEKLLPKELTPKVISEWQDTATIKDVQYKLEVNSYKPTLNSKDKAKLEKKKQVLIRIAGEVVMTEPGKKPARCYKGDADIYIISTEETPKLVGKKSVKLSKLCPS